jgi:hypothetical protein
MKLPETDRFLAAITRTIGLLSIVIVYLAVKFAVDGIEYLFQLFN